MPCALAHSRTSVVFRPFADLRLLPRAGLRALPPHPAASIHVPRQSLSHILGVLGVQVDLILGAVQPEADGTFGGAAVEVIDEQVWIF